MQLAESLQHADIPVPCSTLRRCTEWDVQRADNVQRKMVNLRTPQWRLLLYAPSPSGLPFRQHSYLCCLRLIRRSLIVAGRISDVSESSQVDPLDVLEYEQPIHNLLLCEQLARQPLGTCLGRQPQLNTKMRAILIN